MTSELFLGIDTSNYTTSLALLDSQARLRGERRRILTVPPGKRGIRQSEAVFQHVRNLPELWQELKEQSGVVGPDVTGIAVSGRPRPVADSYMPVFVPGLSLAQTMASWADTSLFVTSHQESHIWAGIYSAKGPLRPNFLALHLSGGTTELHVAQRGTDAKLTLRLLGESIDLHAGQFVDRIGVALGLSFPAGSALDKLAVQASGQVKVPWYHRSGKISFSGPLTALEKEIARWDATEIAAAVFWNIGGALTELLHWAVAEVRLSDVLIVGGVAASCWLRSYLTQQLPELNLYFAEPAFSVDNAVGTALVAAINNLGPEYLGHFSGK